MALPALGKIEQKTARTRWNRISLAQQYALASLPVFLAFSIGIGWWVTRAIELRVIDNASVNAALYVQSIVAPELQGLANRDYLTAEETEAMERLLKDTPLGQRVLSVKVWKEGGKVVYYSRHEFIGRVFEPTANLRRAWAGEVRGEFDDVDVDEEDAVESRLNVPLLEIYSPVLEHDSRRVIAVAEFYENARALETQLASMRFETWLVVLIGAIVTYGVLFGIVQAGGRTIRRQRELLAERVEALSTLLARNEELSRRARGATRRATELNERFLRRVSADLHDGPAQALGLGLLRLDAMATELNSLMESEVPSVETHDDVSHRGGPLGPLAEIRLALQDAMDEVRQISRGLALPELTDLDLAQTLDSAVSRHRSRTGTEVVLSMTQSDEQPRTTLPVRLTVYRLVQESLMNAFRHAGGRGQRVHARVDDEMLVIEVSDDGPGFDPKSAMADAEHLGLRGLRERVESLGGRFRIDSGQDRGTTLVADLPLDPPT